MNFRFTQTVIDTEGARRELQDLGSGGYVSFEIPKWLSLGLIVVILGVAWIYARRQKQRAVAEAESVPETLLNEEERSN